MSADYDTSEAVIVAAVRTPVGSFGGQFMALERGPQAFVIDCAEPHVIKHHFRQVDQFQVVVLGEGPNR
jgi:hypothetical protein